MKSIYFFIVLLLIHQAHANPFPVSLLQGLAIIDFALLNITFMAAVYLVIVWDSHFRWNKLNHIIRIAGPEKVNGFWWLSKDTYGGNFNIGDSIDYLLEDEHFKG